MAITKTWVYDTDATTGFALLYDYLVANAVPEYFDSVLMAEDSTYISCYIGEHEFLKIHDSLYGTNDGIEINTTKGLSVRVKASYSGMRALYMYKCKHGISMQIQRPNYETTIYYPVFTITKDKNGNVAVLAEETIGKSNLNNVSNYYCIAIDDDKINARTLVNAISSTTVLCPIPTDCYNNGGNYIDNVLYMPFYQTRDIGELEINGVRYLNTGMWVVKDE